LGAGDEAEDWLLVCIGGIAPFSRREQYPELRTIGAAFYEARGVALHVKSWARRAVRVHYSGHFEPNSRRGRLTRQLAELGTANPSEQSRQLQDWEVGPGGAFDISEWLDQLERAAKSSDAKRIGPDIVTLARGGLEKVWVSPDLDHHLSAALEGRFSDLTNVTRGFIRAGAAAARSVDDQTIEDYAPLLAAWALYVRGASAFEPIIRLNFDSAVNRSLCELPFRGERATVRVPWRRGMVAPALEWLEACCGPDVGLEFTSGRRGFVLWCKKAEPFDLPRVIARAKGVTGTDWGFEWDGEELRELVEKGLSTGAPLAVVAEAALIHAQDISQREGAIWAAKHYLRFHERGLDDPGLRSVVEATATSARGDEEWARAGRAVEALAAPGGPSATELLRWQERVEHGKEAHEVVARTLLDDARPGNGWAPLAQGVVTDALEAGHGESLLERAMEYAQELGPKGVLEPACGEFLDPLLAAWHRSVGREELPPLWEGLRAWFKVTSGVELLRHLGQLSLPKARRAPFEAAAIDLATAFISATQNDACFAILSRLVLAPEFGNEPRLRAFLEHAVGLLQSRGKTSIPETCPISLYLSRQIPLPTLQRLAEKGPLDRAFEQTVQDAPYARSREDEHPLVHRYRLFRWGEEYAGVGHLAAQSGGGEWRRDRRDEYQELLGDDSKSSVLLQRKVCDYLSSHLPATAPNQSSLQGSSPVAVREWVLTALSLVAARRKLELVPNDLLRQVLLDVLGRFSISLKSVELSSIATTLSPGDAPRALVAELIALPAAYARGLVVELERTGRLLPSDVEGTALAGHLERHHDAQKSQVFEPVLGTVSQVMYSAPVERVQADGASFVVYPEPVLFEVHRVLEDAT